ncbi:MAG: hypothetical protein ACQEV0_00615 [Bacillota bacterium]
MFKKSFAAVIFSFIMILSMGTGAFAQSETIIETVPHYSIEENMSDEVKAAIEDINRTNTKIEAEIAKNQVKADQLYEEYLSKLGKEADSQKQEELTAKYEKQITKLITDLQVKAEKMTLKGMEKAEAAGIEAEIAFVDVKFGDRTALIDPIIVVSW